jgi:hypothetical protein
VTEACALVIELERGHLSFTPKINAGVFRRISGRLPGIPMVNALAFSRFYLELTLDRGLGGLSRFVLAASFGLVFSLVLS